MTDELKALGGAERAPSCRMQLGLNPESCPQAPDVCFHLQGARFMAGRSQETLYRLQGPEGSRPPCNNLGVVGAPSCSPPARRDLAVAALDGTVWQPPRGLLWHQKDKLNKHA